MDKQANFGVVGLGVMGRMLAANVERNGFHVAGFDLDAAKVDAFIAGNAGKNVVGCKTLEAFIAALEKPRRIMLMVPAGKPVDGVIDSLKPVLEKGDLLIDGGNTHFTDTERRSAALEADGIIYIGTGVSGGEYGALWGPAIMPGGQRSAWELTRPIFEAIAAKVDGEPCVAYMGPRGAGHYVKMVHNGIEYGDMQLIAEAYDLLHRGYGLSEAALHDVFDEWNQGELKSYLIEITRDIFAKMDEETGQPLLRVIVDEAKQKGTGKWTSQDALDVGAPTPTINAAVEARIVSGCRDERLVADEALSGPEPRIEGDRDEVINSVRGALYVAKICSYAQGFGLMRVASREYGYNLNYSEIARIWRGGCIIRAGFLNHIRAAFDRNPKLVNLLLDGAFKTAVQQRQGALRQVVQWSATSGIPAPAMSASLAYYDAYRTGRLPANLTQAQRDYFGAHTYHRLDRDGACHTEWMDMSTPPEG